MTFGKLHLLVLHFPLALIIVAAVADALWLFLRKDIFRQAGFFCILLGAAAAIPTVVTGSALLDAMEYVGEFAELGETHEHFAIATLVVALVAAGLRALRRNKLAGLWAWSYGVLMLAAVAFVGIAGHYGGLLAFGKDYLK